MINKFVLFGQHHITVQRQEASEFLRFKHVDALKLALSAVQLLVDLDRKPHVGRVHFGKPQFHGLFSLQNINGAYIHILGAC